MRRKTWWHNAALRSAVTAGGGFGRQLAALKAFIESNGSRVAATHPDQASITLGSTSATLGGTLVARTDSKIRYMGGPVAENFALTQPGSGPQATTQTTKNLSYSSSERGGDAQIVEFDITCPKFEVLEYAGESNGGCRILVDGMDAGSFSTPSDGTQKYRLFDFSAINAAAQQRHIRLEYSNRSLLGGIKLDTVGTMLTLQSTPAKRVVHLGDSFTEAVAGLTGPTRHNGLAPYCAKLLGFEDYNISGFGGTGYEKTNDPGFGSLRPGLATRIGWDVGTADLYVVAMGINDDKDSATLPAAIATTLDTIRAANPSALVLAVGVYGNGSGAATTNKLQIDTMIQAAVATRPGMRFFSIYGVSFTKTDAVHPDAAGHVTLGTALAADIKSWVNASIPQTVPVNLVAPATPTGTLHVGDTLTAPGLGTWSGTTPITYARQWFNTSGDISAATGPTYVLQSGDLTKSVGVRVTATNANGSVSASSSSVGPVIAAVVPVSVISRIQSGTITIGAASLSNTATITSVDATKSILIFEGINPTSTAQTNGNRYATRIALTNGTTVTATRENSSDAVTVAFTVIEFASGVNSIQAGTIAMSAAETSKAATISAVGANAFVLLLGGSTATASLDITPTLGAVILTDSTTVTAHCFLGTAMTVGYMVVDLDSTVVNSAQTVAITSAGTGFTDTGAISSVATANSLFFYNGMDVASTINTNSGAFHGRLSSSTGVTYTRNGTVGTSRTHYGTVVEFASAALNGSAQRGTIALAAAASNTATITSVDTSKAVVNWHGFLGANANPNVVWPKLVLTDATTVTASLSAAGTVTVAYEVLPFL